MKNLLLGMLVFVSLSAIAGTEVVCQKFYQTEMKTHIKESTINNRIKSLESSGKTVAIKELSTSSSISRLSPFESSILEKECVILNY
jgi:hypothetical protein